MCPDSQQHRQRELLLPHLLPLVLLQVFRGYVGDKSAPPVFETSTQLGKAFNTLGEGYQRPFELATLRLQNMAGILPKCDHHLKPPVNCMKHTRTLILDVRPRSAANYINMSGGCTLLRKDKCYLHSIC